MSLPMSISVFFIVWWTVLFAVLPWGVRSQIEDNQVVRGSEPGAPSKPMLLKKMIWTTGIAAILFAGIYVVVSYQLISL